MPPRGSFRNLLEKFGTFLRRHSPSVSLLLGLTVAVGAALSWHYQKIGFINGSLFIGIGSSAIAAGIVGFLSPLYETGYRRFVSLGIQKVWPSRNAVPKRDWVDWIIGAQNKCTLLGIAHNNWCKDVRFAPALTDRLNRGITVKVLFLDPESESAKLRDKEETNRSTTNKIRESIEYLWSFRKELKPAVRDRLRLYVYDATASCGLTWIDDFMIVTHYLARMPDLTSPAIRLQPAQIGTGGLYDVYAENVEKIETECSTELDDRNIHEFLPKIETETIPATQTSIIPTRQVEERGSDIDAD